MDIITLTKENIATEHICCSMSSKSTEVGVNAKKEWLSCRMQEGLRFKKLDARGKVFIEYLPAENAWVPVEANGYMLINCFWVSGSFKEHGYGKQLLAECEADARQNGFKGVTLIAGQKKKPFLSDKAFMLRQGYEVCDNCPPYFELLVKRFDNIAPLSRFKESAKKGMGEGIKGIDIFYTAQCPFTVPYTKLLEPVILESEYPVRLHHITTKEMAQAHVAPITTYTVFIDGKYYSNEILTPDKLKKLIAEKNNRHL
ncbi:GNAT family N-acetyltransferase [Prevotella sp. 10(H)]|uniref:GNAT family N-acetyltransferase n=1 Tax=Prevotella sp. 10(H) TaxID=1158294 RepID=UPI0004A722CE|nr:GNAT family N-acetyltransferase [Prevotella sp. 10(H)]